MINLYVEVNRALIAEGLRPLGRDATLDDVAQTIADELSATGEYVSLPRILADQLGYPRWPDGGQRVISEAVNLIGIETPAEFAATWREPLTEILLNTFYREIGVGVATRIAVEGGTEQNVYVVILGAQPNVLPVIINDGAPTVYNQQIELYIQNEQSLAYETSDEIIQFAPHYPHRQQRSGIGIGGMVELGRQQLWGSVAIDGRLWRKAHLGRI